MGRTVRFSFMALVYAFLYLPIIVLIVNSFNANKFGMKWEALPPSGTKH